jgi:hypothetical protein
MRWKVYTGASDEISQRSAVPGMSSFVSTFRTARLGNSMASNCQSLVSMARCGSMLRGSFAPICTVIALLCAGAAGASA